MNKKETQKGEDTYWVDLSLETTLHQFTKYSNYLTSSLTEPEPNAARNQREESKERIAI